jgi:DNA-binding IclR family transcriptional regulator
MSSGSQHYHVRALERALDLLDAFTISEPELSFSELVSRIDLAKSTTFRLIAILEERGYLERSPDTDRYRIGIRAFEIGSIYIQSTQIEAEAQPFLHQLALTCNQTANLAVLDHDQIVHIAVVAPDRPIRYYATIGQREYAHSTGLGKALLCDHDDEQLARLAEHMGLPKKTERTIVDLDKLSAHLAHVREQGYAIDDEESVLGLTCIAAPIRDERNRIVAAVSVSGPLFDFSAEQRPELIDAVLNASKSISARMGNAIRAG